MTISDYIRTAVNPNFDGNLPFSIHQQEFERNSIITDYEAVESKIYYLQSGIVEVYIPHGDNERILDFFFPGNFFCSFTSLLQQCPSDVSIRTFSDCTVEVIDYEELQGTFQDSLLANQLARLETQKLYLRKVRREKALLTKSTEERYRDMLEHHPNYLAEIPLQRIAMYLGVRPESLSRIRRKMIS